MLVLEDDPSIRATLCTMLAHAGFTTLSAQTVEDAFAILARERVDAVSLDVRVPDPKGLDRSGLSLLATLRTMPGYASLPAMIFTGMPLTLEEEAVARTLNAPIFYKPQPYAVLIQHLNRQLQPQRVVTRQDN